MEATPFTAEALKAAAKAEFERRLPTWIENTKEQIKNQVAYGIFKPEIKTREAGTQEYDAYHYGVVAALRAEGLVVTDSEVGFVVDLS